MPCLRSSTALLAALFACGASLTILTSTATAVAGPQKGDVKKGTKDKAAAKPVDGGKKDKPAKDKGRSKDKGGEKKQTAEAVGPKGPVPIELHLDVQRAALDNGMRIVLCPDHASATVAVNVDYDVGGRNEEQGRSGFAHLFEHMMFQGSANVLKGEHSKLIAGRGGVMNGTTNKDRTAYYETLPSSDLALAIWLEADRMKSLDVSESNFENQRKVVEEEYRMRYANVPYQMGRIRLEELVYQGFWPYEHPTIGSLADLDGAKLDWVQDFHARHYGPNNAVIAVAGDFDPVEAVALVHKYFDPIPRADVTDYDDVALAEQTSQRTAVVKDDNANTPGIAYGWAVPPAHTHDHYALELAAVMLAGGESSRLHQLLVRDRSVALEVSADLSARRGPDLFVVDAKVAPGVKVGEVEKIIEGEIRALSTNGPSDAELGKAKRVTESAFVLGLETNLERAQRLADQELMFADARQINAELPRYFAVQKDDVKRVLAKFLGPTQRTVVETYPSSQAPIGGEPPRPAGTTPKKAAKGDPSAPKKAGGGKKSPKKKK